MADDTTLDQSTPDQTQDSGYLQKLKDLLSKAGTAVGNNLDAQNTISTNAVQAAKNMMNNPGAPQSPEDQAAMMAQTNAAIEPAMGSLGVAEEAAHAAAPVAKSLLSKVGNTVKGFIPDAVEIGAKSAKNAMSPGAPVAAAEAAAPAVAAATQAAPAAEDVAGILAKAKAAYPEAFATAPAGIKQTAANQAQTMNDVYNAAADASKSGTAAPTTMRDLQLAAQRANRATDFAARQAKTEAQMAALRKLALQR